MNASKSVHAWERLGWVLSVIFYLSLLLPWAYWMAQGRGTPVEDRLVLGLVLTGGLAHWFFAFELPRRGVDVRGRLLYSLVYAGVITGVFFGLIAIHDVFFFVLGTFFSQLFYFLPVGWSAYLSVAVMPILAIQANYINSLADGRRQPVGCLGLLAGV